MEDEAEDIVVDKQEQLEKIKRFCLDNETIHAVLDLKGGGTGFVAILDKRIIFYDRAFTHKKKAMVTIPYNRIHAISSADDSGILLRRGFFASSTLTIHAGYHSFEFVFRGGDKAHMAYKMIVEHILE